MKFIPDTSYVEEMVIENKKNIFYNHQNNINSWNNITDYINYTPNWLHKDGRINATLPGGQYKVAEVSPYNPLFETQVEDGVWPLVKAFIDKGYLTCSSCEGHGWDLKCRVSVVMPTLESCFHLVEQLSMDSWEIKIEENRLIYDYDSSLKTTKNILNREELKKNVFPHYNKIFRRNYEEYFYIDFFLPKYQGLGFLWNFFKKTPSKKSKIQMKRMIDRITNELPHSIY